MSEVKDGGLENKLINTCKDAFNDILIDPAVEISSVTVTRIEKGRFDSDRETTCYVVSVKTNDASMLRGDVSRFKGSYKERVEAILDFVVKQCDDSAEAHLDISGSNTSTVDRMLSVSHLIRTGKLKEQSPIVRTARAYQIPYILLRGRHFVGPSPAMAAVLRDLIDSGECQCKKVLDLFSGTGIASKVVCQHGAPKKVVLVEKDPMKAARIQDHIQGSCVELVEEDSLEFSTEEWFDLIVADPYYEDVLVFLRAQLSQIVQRTAVFLLVVGGVENFEWTRVVLATLEGAGLTIKRHTAFGQVILECAVPGP